MIAIIAVVALACIMGAQAQAPSSLPPPFAIPLNSSATVTPALITGACTGQGSLPVCNPLSTSGMTYIDCKGKKVASCRSGTVFDYVSRKCLRPNVASKCPSYMCPVTGGAALGRPYGTFGQTGNLTLRLPTRDSFRVICPVNGHCQGGMTFQVNVACPAPPERYPYVWMIDWDTTLENNSTYPQRLADINAYCGDVLFLAWDEPIHLVQIFNNSAANKAAWSSMSVQNYPPQPVYPCPMWPADFEGYPVPRPGIDTVVSPIIAGAGNGTWVANKTGSFMVACPLSNHCRLGMVFKATVVAAPLGYTPKVYPITWGIQGWNYPDVSLFVGDSLFINWGAVPPMAHGIFVYPA